LVARLVEVKVKVPSEVEGLVGLVSWRMS